MFTMKCEDTDAPINDGMARACFVSADLAEMPPGDLFPSRKHLRERWSGFLAARPFTPAVISCGRVYEAVLWETRGGTHSPGELTQAVLLLRNATDRDGITTLDVMEPSCGWGTIRDEIRDVYLDSDVAITFHSRKGNGTGKEDKKDAEALATPERQGRDEKNTEIGNVPHQEGADGGKGACKGTEGERV